MKNNEEKDINVETNSSRNPKAFIKKAWKPVTAILVALCLIGGGAAFLFERHEDKQDEKTRAAMNDMIQAEAKSSKVDLISEAQVKQIVSKKIAVAEKDITFDSISLKDASYKKDKDHEKDKQQVATTKTDSPYIYDVDCTANSLEYELTVDAVTGTIYDVDIDD